MLINQEKKKSSAPKQPDFTVQCLPLKLVSNSPQHHSIKNISNIGDHVHQLQGPISILAENDQMLEQIDFRLIHCSAASTTAGWMRQRDSLKMHYSN